MKKLLILLALFSSGSLAAQTNGWDQAVEEDTTIQKYNLTSPQPQVNEEDPRGRANIYFSPILSSDFGFNFGASFLKGKGRLKTGFNFGTSLMHFNDTLKNDTGDIIDHSRPISSLSIGFSARFHDKYNNFFAGEANYIVAFNDQRFGATNGVGIKMSFGSYLKHGFYFEGGLMAQVFQTNTNERPGSIGLIVGFGIAL